MLKEDNSIFSIIDFDYFYDAKILLYYSISTISILFLFRLYSTISIIFIILFVLGIVGTVSLYSTICIIPTIRLL